MPNQKASVESCIRVLSDVGKMPLWFGFTVMRTDCLPTVKATISGALALALLSFHTPEVAEPGLELKSC